MNAFDHCFDVLIEHEGGYTNNPADPGGETKFGLSKRAFPSLDIKNLTIEDAKIQYQKHYWTPIQGDALPPAVALLAFDAAVNNGVGQAAKWLQAAAGVAVDGRIGPKTLSAIAADPAGVAERFMLLRVRMMTALPTWGSFGRGWAVRLVQLGFQARAVEAAALAG